MLSLKVVVFAICISLISSQDVSIVETQYGPIQGNVTSLGRAFTSIPYAAPPIGSLRWQNPIAPTPWTSILECKSAPPGCIQLCNLGKYACPKVRSEDCLYLNVFTPPTSSNDTGLHPVMVFIHGGSFVEGYSGGWLYNGTNMASLTNTVIVTINYRLGVIGFLYDEENELIGNYGYMDQKFAIQWVYDNIPAFWGDPARITIYGESAGAVSVALHIMDTSTIPLFVNAIMESEPIGVPLRDAKSWQGVREDFYEYLGCDTRTCLYNATASKVWSIFIILLSVQYITKNMFYLLIYRY